VFVYLNAALGGAISRRALFAKDNSDEANDKDYQDAPAHKQHKELAGAETHVVIVTATVSFYCTA
jgi:hypothetical protein